MAACWVAQKVDGLALKTADRLAADLAVTKAASLVAEMVVVMADRLAG